METSFAVPKSHSTCGITHRLNIEGQNICTSCHGQTRNKLAALLCLPHRWEVPTRFGQKGLKNISQLG